MRRRVLASLTVLALATAACGGDDPPDSSTPDGEVTDVSVEGGEVQRGGQIVVALGAETDGFDPVRNRWGVAGYQVGFALYDPLVAYDADGVPKPYLAESFEADDDNTTWTFTLRPGIEFHDGTPLTAAHVVDVFQRHLASPLTGPVFAAVESVEATDDLTLRFDLSSPWAAFPGALTSQVGVIPAASVIDTPEGPQNPVGTGPFVLDEYVADRELSVVANEDYWREGLPYLGGITFQPLVDQNTRQQAFDAGDIDLFSTANGAVIAEWADRCDGTECQLVVDPGETDEALVILNTAVPPFDNPLARRAVAHALDRQALLDVLAPGAGASLANGPFAPESPWFDQEAADAFPDHDPDEARRLAEAYEAETGEPLRFTIRSSAEATILRGVQISSEQLADVGIEAEVETTDQQTLILDVIGGQYQAAAWQQFGEPDPDLTAVWWSSTSVLPPGQLSLNAARNANPTIDEALRIGRESTDRAERVEAYAEVQRQLNEDLPYVWLFHVNFAFIAGPDVRGVANGPLPDGSPSLPFMSGASRPTHLWLDR